MAYQISLKHVKRCFWNARANAWLAKYFHQKLVLARSHFSSELPVYSDPQILYNTVGIIDTNKKLHLQQWSLILKFPHTKSLSGGVIFSRELIHFDLLGSTLFFLYKKNLIRNLKLNLSKIKKKIKKID